VVADTHKMQDNSRPHRRRCSASVSGVSTLASASMVSMPFSFSTFCNDPNDQPKNSTISMVSMHVFQTGN
jgi:hypothetical protein